MSAVVQPAATRLKFSPGSALVYAPASGDLRLDMAALAGGVDFAVTAEAEDGRPLRRFRVSVVEEALEPVDLAVVTRFDAAEKLAELGFVGVVAPSWTQEGGFARLVPAATSRTHGNWARAGGDGFYRCLFRVRGGLPVALDRRFSFGARVRLAEADWLGVRVELFETTAGERRIHIREYTGASGVTASLATATAGWEYDAWQWLEVSLDGPAVKGRVYAEAVVAPAWQVEAVTRQLQAGAFGPGGFPASGLAPVIDIRALEFVPLG